MLHTAIIGMGGFGTNLARRVTDHPDATIAAAVDVNPDNLERAAGTFDLDDEILFTDAAEMYAESTLDAVVIATPPAFHRQQIQDAFDRGLHVLCEKPVVIDLEEAHEIAALAESSDLTLMAGYQRHLDPAFREGYRRWHEGDAEPTFITGELTQDWSAHFESGTNWRTDPEIGGRGHLFSVGTHVVESILWMTGLTPTHVAAEMEFYDDEEWIDMQSSLTVRFDNGSIASLADSAAVATERERIRIWDENGALQLNARDWGRPTLTELDTEGTETVREVDHEGAEGKFEAFARAIETGEEPPATVDDVLRVTALLDAAYESARTGERVAVDLETTSL
ncbi:Gfo/Idh/MocA family oxidoreductase [Halobacteria archaeon AArc-m2/3/4]|uniref:Gfo/Idh/MocA family oxidoreductase n=1 Tax=Natronoglomus mannanivorans TaxID=2979990 RepID=A0AAP3E297_9EURY|nr:Gfo/Idh/MocA family oxidoreductase [Halobacteria archaeon AArc-xg1-1]MCU4973516.1 Gfo/Idh/MocA family oxidoreductase [Halobacteria archaeon AArc-m2/3/4]